MPANLPITANAPQTAAQVARKPAGSPTPDDAQSAPGFMELLAKQLKGPQLGDTNLDTDLIAAAIEKNATIVPVGDVPVDETVTGTIPADTVTAASPSLPGEMLAAMMSPQASAQAVPSATTPVPATDSSKDSTPVAPRIAPVAAGRAEAAGKTATAALPADASDKSERAAPKAGQPQFSATLAGQQTSRPELLIASREIPVASPAQTAAPLVALQTAAANLAVATQQPVVQAAVNTPVGRERWGEDFSQRITWLTTPRQDQTAQLHLNPPQLGPLDVVLKVNGDNATALFSSPHAAVRDAVEQALPRLREMLADNGIALGNATVSDQAPRESSSEAARRQASAAGAAPDDAADPAESAVRVSPIPRHDGIVDTFA